MIEITTGILLNPGSLKAFHSLPSNQNDKLITKFQEEKMLNKAKAFILIVLVLKVVKFLSMKVFATTKSSYGANAKLCC